MTQMREALVLGDQLAKTADSLNLTPDSQLRTQQRKEYMDSTEDREIARDAATMQNQEYINQAPTRQSVNTANRLKAESAATEAETQAATEQFFVENPLSLKDNMDKQYKAYEDYMREQKLYNPIQLAKTFTKNMIQTEQFYTAKEAAGKTYAKNIAKTYQGSIQNLFSLESTNPEPTVLAEGASNLTVGLNDAFKMLDEDIKMDLQFTGKYDRFGKALYNLSHTDMVDAAKYDKSDNHKFAEVMKRNVTLAEVQSYSQNLLSGNLAAAPSAYVLNEQKRVAKNVDNMTNPSMIYSFSGGGVLGAYGTVNEQGQHSVTISKGGSGAGKTGYADIETAMQAADSVKLSDADALIVKNMYSAWYAQSDGQSKMPQSYIDRVNKVALTLPSVQGALARRNAGAGAKSVTEFTKKVQTVVGNMFDSKFDGKDLISAQRVAAIYGPGYQKAGYSPDQLAAEIARASKAYDALTPIEQEKLSKEQWVSSHVADALDTGMNLPIIPPPPDKRKTLGFIGKRIRGLSLNKYEAKEAGKQKLMAEMAEKTAKEVAVRPPREGARTYKADFSKF